VPFSLACLLRLQAVHHPRYQVRPAR
jgi:hypothetical protein